MADDQEQKQTPAPKTPDIGRRILGATLFTLGFMLTPVIWPLKRFAQTIQKLRALDHTVDPAPDSIVAYPTDRKKWLAKQKKLKEQKIKQEQDLVKKLTPHTTEDTQRMIADIQQRKNDAMAKTDQTIMEWKTEKMKKRDEDISQAHDNIIFFFSHLSDMPVNIEERQKKLLQQKLAEMLQKISGNPVLATEKNLDALVRFIKATPHKKLRENAILELGLMGHRSQNEMVAEKAFYCLKSILEDSNETNKLRLTVIRHLQLMGSAYPHFLQTLSKTLEVSALHDKNMTLRKTCLSALSNLAKKDSDSAHQITPILKEFIEENRKASKAQKSPALRGQALQSLKNIIQSYPHKDLKNVIAAYKETVDSDKDAATRIIALRCMGDLKTNGPKQKSIVLKTMQRCVLNDTNAKVKQAAIEGLETFRQRDKSLTANIRDTFQQAAREDKNVTVRVTAIQNLGRIGLLPDHNKIVRNIFNDISTSKKRTPKKVKDAVQNALKNMNQEWTAILAKKADSVPKKLI